MDYKFQSVLEPLKRSRGFLSRTIKGEPRNELMDESRETEYEEGTWLAILDLRA